MARSVTPFLMFEGSAEAAINLYISLFPGSVVHHIDRFGPGEAGAEGSVKQAELTIAGQRLRCFDSPVKHSFTFTPSISLFVDFDSQTELEVVFAQLSTGGTVMMPPDNYGFSTRFAWINDRFGVSWQLNLP